LEQAAIETDFTLIDPVGYFDMIELLKHCSLVMTDSGGLQKEAFFFHKNCVTLREETEWIELVEHGYNLLAGADKNEILKSFQQMESVKNNFSEKFYGDGEAVNKIADMINRI
jgi:UDP-GlcNAc3NAcA epimerase